jgi:hypothetical protein
MTAERLKSFSWTLHASLLIGAATVLSAAGCCGLGGSGGLVSLVPGRKEAEFRNRVEHDSFPTAGGDLHAPAGSAGK